MKFATKLVLWVVLVAFFVTTVNPTTARADLAFLPAPGTMVSLTPAYAPPLVRGIKVYKDNPFKFDFIVDAGDSKYGPNDPAFKESGKKLIAYFLASLTTPEKDMWVNLSPYEKDRIIPQNFGDTQMGNELLAQDYLLKQVTSSLMYPEGETGREFWKKIYMESLKRFGSLNIVVNTLNKVWIVPDRAVVYENPKDNTVVLVESRLKVMLEEDYLALTKQKVEVAAANQQMSNDIIREVVVPALEKEVNEGRNFASLRQVYHSLILATWYKNNLKKSILSRGYVDRNKTNGIDIENKNLNQLIYEQYLKSYRKGVYNYIKEEVDPATNTVVPKKHFSGGFTALGLNSKIQNEAAQNPDAAKKVLTLRNVFLFTAGLTAFAGINNDSNSYSLPTAQPPAITAQAPQQSPDKKVDSIVIKAGDTASGIVKKISNNKVSFEKAVKSGSIKLVNADGSTVQDANFNVIKPGQKLVIDLTNINNVDTTSVQPAVASAGPPPPDKDKQLKAAIEVSPKTQTDAQLLQATVELEQNNLQVLGEELSKLESTSNQLDQNDTEDIKAIDENNKAIDDLRERIQEKADAIKKMQVTLERQRVDEENLVKEYELKVKPQEPIAVVESQDPDLNVSFTPNAVGLAWVDNRIEKLKRMETTLAPVDPPITALFMSNWNEKFLGQKVFADKKGNSISLVPDVPGSQLIELGQITKGLSNFSAQPTLSKIMGPLVGLDILMKLRNYAATFETEGQDTLYDTRMTTGGAILQTLTVRSIPIESYDQNGNRVTNNVYSMGLMDTMQAAFSKGNSEVYSKFGYNMAETKSFVRDQGVQIGYGKYHIGFDYGASINKDPNVMSMKVFKIEDKKIRYRINKDKGFDVVPDDVPEDARLDYYKASVKGFVLRYDPESKKMIGQHAFTGPTFVTAQFARTQWEKSYGKFSEDNDKTYMNEAFFERILSMDDYKNEKMLLQGRDVVGRVIYGALRSSLTGRIEKLITDPLELLTLSKVINKDGTTVTFEVGKKDGEVKQKSVVMSYFKDQWDRSENKWNSLVKSQTEAERRELMAKGIAGRPVLNEVPVELKDLLSAETKIADFPINGPAAAIQKAGEAAYGVVYYTDGGAPGVLKNLDKVRLISSLKEANRVIQNPDGTFSIEGVDVEFSGNTMVVLNPDGFAVGIVSPSLRAMEARLPQLDIINANIMDSIASRSKWGMAVDQDGNPRALTGDPKAEGFKPAKYITSINVIGQPFGQDREPDAIRPGMKKTLITADMMVKVVDGKVVEIIGESGRSAIKNQTMVIKTLMSGGLDVEDNRQEAGSIVFAKGNNLTQDQIDAGIQPERELVKLVINRQAIQVPVPNTLQKKFVILATAKPSKIAVTLESDQYPQTLDDIANKFVLVRFKSKNPASKNSQEAKKDLESQLIPITVFQARGAEIMRDAVEVLKPGTQDRYQKMLNGGFQLVAANQVSAFLNKHYLVTTQDGKRAGFLPIEKLKTRSVHEDLRKAKADIQIIDVNENVTTRVYLDKNMESSLIEVITEDVSRIYELMTFISPIVSDPVIETVSKTINGLLHVKSKDLRNFNPEVIVEDVYKPVKNGKPIKLYSIRNLQKEIIYFKDGHEYYSTAMPNSQERGQSVVIDGKVVEHVTGLYQYNKKSDTGYHVSLRQMDRKNWHAPLRQTVFEDNQIKTDLTGFVKLDPSTRLTHENIMAQAFGQELFRKKDAFTYDQFGKLLKREVSYFGDGVWNKAEVITSGHVGAQPVLVAQLTKNKIIADAFEKFGLSKDAELTEAFKVNTLGVKTTDYRIKGDVLERKFISIIEEGGKVMQVIVGLDFQQETGEQVSAFELTSDYQVKAILETKPNDKTIAQILPDNITSIYSNFVKKHLNISDADFFSDVSAMGVTAQYKPDMVIRTSLIIESQGVSEDSYKAVEQTIRPLYRQYIDTKDPVVRANILNNIQDIIRKHHESKARYTNKRGDVETSYLFPNDSLGRSIMSENTQGKSVNIWWKANQTLLVTNSETRNIKVNPLVMPSSIVLDRENIVKNSVLLKGTETMNFRGSDNKEYPIQVNVYHVGDHDLFHTRAYTATGRTAYQENWYVRNRVANGILGTQVRGLVRDYYDVLSDIPIVTYQNMVMEQRGEGNYPIQGTLPEEDGRLTQTLLEQSFGQDVDGKQIITIKTLKADPTAPEMLTIQQQQIKDGEPIIKSMTQLDALKSSWNEFLEYWKVFPSIAGIFVVLFSVGGVMSAWRLSQVKKRIKALKSGVEPEGIKAPVKHPVVYPLGNSYGFSDSVVQQVKEWYDGTILPDLERGESLEDILALELESYMVWRKTVMKIDDDYKPSLEDSWLLQLIYTDGGMFRSDLPDGLNYLLHKAIEARDSGKGEDIADFIHKEFRRWHRLTQTQQTTFQGLDGGPMKNVVPYDFYFRTEDLEDMFLNRENILWYDSLGFTLDGKKDLRDALYDDFITALEQRTKEVKEELTTLAGKAKGNVFELKRLAASSRAYQDYVSFFKLVNRGGYEVSDAFNFNGVDKEKAWGLINNKPFIRKSFNDAGALIGKLPAPIRIIRAFAQLIRGNYQQITNSLLLTAGTGLGVAAFDGMITGTMAAITAGALFIVTKLLYYPLSFILDRNVNNKAFGKSAPFWAGYDKLKANTAEKWYRRGFWSVAISLKVAWDAVLLHYFLIPHRETIGATYFPTVNGVSLPWDWNAVLMASQWSTSVFFLFLAGWSSYYFVGSIFSYIHGKARGLGVIKTAKDIRNLEKDHVLEELIDVKLLPNRGVGMTTEARQEARALIFDFIGKQMRDRDEISDAEYQLLRNGVLDKFKSEYIQKRIADFVNTLIMDSPDQPHFDAVRPSTIMTPVYGEDIIYAYNEVVNTATVSKEVFAKVDGNRGVAAYDALLKQGVLEKVGDQDHVRVARKGPGSVKRPVLLTGLEYDEIWDKLQKTVLPTALEMELNVGYTNLNFIISKAPQRWENFIKRAEREGFASEDELDRMKVMLTQKGKLGFVNKDLEMQIRLWATYEGQSYARTLDGMMNYVRWLQILAKISHPEWSQDKIREEVNNKFQMIWAYQIWGDILSAKENEPDKELKKKDTFYLLKKYYDELGIRIDVASIQKRNGVWYKVRSQYKPAEDPKTVGEISDVRAIAIGEYRPIFLEGKPANQSHASSFARFGVTFTVDMNQDLFAEMAIKFSILLEEFKDKTVAMINFPEKIFTEGFTLTAMFHAIADRTFVTSSKRQLSMLLSAFHHGHPDGWLSRMIRNMGGVSSTTSVSEDFIGGQRLVMRGKRIKNVEYIEFGKARELSWVGTDGIFRKFAMGAAQYMLSRFAVWGDKRLGPLEGAANFYGGVPFYFQQTIASIGLLTYTLNVMVLGISSFAAIPTAIVMTMLGALVVGQSITANGFTQMALEHGPKKAVVMFAKLMPVMFPFFIAHLFTYEAGFLSGLLGVAAYVATGRGFNREHIRLDSMLKLFGKTHATMGEVGIVLFALAVGIWQNWTLLYSSIVGASFIFRMFVPTLMNSGNLPIHKVSSEAHGELFREDLKIYKGKIKQHFQAGSGTLHVIKAFKNSVLTSIASIPFFATAPAYLGTASVARVREVVRKNQISNFSAANDEGSAVQKIAANEAMASNPGGINIGLVNVEVRNKNAITTAFDDQAMLQLLINADGLSPVIYGIKPMTPSMVQTFVGSN